MTDNYAPHWRLEALKIAVKTFDQDDPIPGADLFVVAQDILNWILDGETGPHLIQSTADPRMEMTLKDMPNYSSGKTEVSTVERREHPEQEDEDDDD